MTYYDILVAWKYSLQSPLAPRLIQILESEARSTRLYFDLYLLNLDSGTETTTLMPAPAPTSNGTTVGHEKPLAEAASGTRHPPQGAQQRRVWDPTWAKSATVVTSNQLERETRSPQKTLQMQSDQ